MRCIDADALIPMMKYATTDSEIGVFPIKIGFNDIEKVINEQPTIEAQRKKGKWIEHNPHKWGLGIVFECSECGEKIDCEPSNFCPNCGAEMTEGEE